MKKLLSIILSIFLTSQAFGQLGFFALNAVNQLSTQGVASAGDLYVSGGHHSSWRVKSSVSKPVEHESLVNLGSLISAGNVVQVRAVEINLADAQIEVDGEKV
jgi:hypothetical protein